MSNETRVWGSANTKENARTEDEFKAYAYAELRNAVPKDWIVNLRFKQRYQDRPLDDVSLKYLEWKIFKKEWEGFKDYVVRVSDDMKMLVVLHSNTYRHFGVYTRDMLMRERVSEGTLISDLDTLQSGELTRIVSRVTNSHPPNEHIEAT
jgi:hypothetical protein